MPDSDVELVSNEWLRDELRAGCKDLIVLDCRSANDYAAGHVRGAVNFSIPSIILRRLATGKITAAIKCRDMKKSTFVLYGPQQPLGSGQQLNASDVVSVLHRRLKEKEEDCRVVFLKGELELLFEVAMNRLLVLSTFSR